MKRSYSGSDSDGCPLPAMRRRRDSGSWNALPRYTPPIGSVPIDIGAFTFNPPIGQLPPNMGGFTFPNPPIGQLPPDIMGEYNFSAPINLLPPASPYNNQSPSHVTAFNFSAPINLLPPASPPRRLSPPMVATYPNSPRNQIPLVFGAPRSATANNPLTQPIPYSCPNQLPNLPVKRPRAFDFIYGGLHSGGTSPGRTSPDAKRQKQNPASHSPQHSPQHSPPHQYSPHQYHIPNYELNQVDTALEQAITADELWYNLQHGGNQDDHDDYIIAQQDEHNWAYRTKGDTDDSGIED